MACHISLSELPTVLRRNFSLDLAHSLTRTRRTDQFLISFPRSGSTWLRAILARLIDPSHGAEPEVFNRLIPGMSGRRLPAIWGLRDPRIIHSHTPYRRGIPRAVYIVRDGRDAIVSYYHYTTTRAGRSMSFADWFDCYVTHRYGPRWDENVEGWLTHGRIRLKNQLLVLKFEDLKSKPGETVERAANFLRLNSGSSAVTAAIEASNLERAREREIAEYGPIADPNASFFRGGRTGQWQEYDDEVSRTPFHAINERALQLAGYL